MTAKLVVTAVGLLLVGWVNWYFLFSRRPKPAATERNRKTPFPRSSGQKH
jgi:plastocyanin domain-containing protein